jgi:hypothetical protein
MQITATITRPGYTRHADGREVPPTDVMIDALAITTIDDSDRNVVRCQLTGKKAGRLVCLLPRMFVLWEGDAYNAAGDYTQADIEARVIELLGADVKAGLDALFLRSA